ncbi:bifunctional adenosylcobinamide kinase/adenosylcobinamide-phosphate guanylyltransferase [Pueribacillus sp. YX66]|uniref:bifunctional adenosylcobinamide kinase/adenosylcobinamide-phosphate guanylyltransferase n=1 Tax=Pueribacillus sp. YX66 TaxID=3229242 RepID=UPI00358D3D23
MHFVIGGAFNGKRKWVKQHYKNKFTIDWRSAYRQPFRYERFEDISTFATCIVLEGIEYYIKAKMTYAEEADSLRGMFNKQLIAWRNWENEDEERTLILIGNDFSKGIVPTEREDRLWRDVTGWCYQDIVAQASRVDKIWYGISKQIK